MGPKIHSPMCLIVRCLAEQKGDQWQAFSLEFGLAAQADSFAEVKKKLDAMIQGYLSDALVGEDREHAYELMRRKAHWRVFARYHFARVAQALRHSKHSMEEGVRLFSEPMGLEPKPCS